MYDAPVIGSVFDDRLFCHMRGGFVVKPSIFILEG